MITSGANGDCFLAMRKAKTRNTSINGINKNPKAIAGTAVIAKIGLYGSVFNKFY